MTPGPRNLITDVPGLLVGNASDAGLKSGTTVLTADSPFVASVHVMGGAPGTRETDLLAPDKTVQDVDALVLSGGSAFGLDACSGVMDTLRAADRGFPVGPVRVPIVPGAILFDLLNGGDKSWRDNPYRALGKQAFKAASAHFDIGTAGAGTGALCAQQKGGLGSASADLGDGIFVGALVAVNALGSVTTPGNRHFWAAPFEEAAEFGGLGADPRGGLGDLPESRKEGAIAGMIAAQANTTIAIVATNANLTKTQCHRMAVTAHDGMSRAIVPSHTPGDGDLVFAASTREVEVTPEKTGALCAIAAVCLSRAIARGVYEATAQSGDLLPAYRG